MARSNKPVVWGPFAAGGTVTAFMTPVLIVLTLLVSVGAVPEVLTYEGARAFASHVVGKLAIFAVVSLSLWASAHRLRITFYDLGVRADTVVSVALYFAAAAGAGLTALFLARM
jgi:fumarate reductase subunit D